ncbi:MAG: hypothetical protein DRQ97_00340 [Gammaproteobacteria bacterium]|nr:MAG: hypothetical protein DRQ97_00340 [Gammaproteobacteria bacterium]
MPDDKSLEAHIQTSILSPDELQRLVKRVPMCEKVGVVHDGDDYYFAMFKRPGSTKPVAMVPLIHVMMCLETYIDGIDDLH